MSENVINEIRSVPSNVSMIKQQANSRIPSLLVVSNGMGTGFDTETWQRYQINHFERLHEAEIVFVDCPHYLHDYEYEHIAMTIRHFIDAMG